MMGEGDFENRLSQLEAQMAWGMFGEGERTAEKEDDDKDEGQSLPIVPIGGGSGGGMFAWDPETKTIGPGGVMAGRKWVAATGTGTAGMGDGTYRLKVTFNGLDATAEVTADAVTLSDTECWIPIYTVSGGEVATDHRGAFAVQCWEA